MINPLQPNAGAIRSSETKPAANSAPAKQVSSSESGSASQDTAEVSPFSHEFDMFMNMLRGTPDVRPDTVAKARDAVNSPVAYPPLSIVSGIGNLVGNLLKKPDSEGS